MSNRSGVAELIQTVTNASPMHSMLYRPLPVIMWW